MYEVSAIAVLACRTFHIPPDLYMRIRTYVDVSAQIRICINVQCSLIFNAVYPTSACAEQGLLVFQCANSCHLFVDCKHRYGMQTMTSNFCAW